MDVFFSSSTLERIAWFCMSQGEERLPYADIDESFRQRPAYQEGCLTDEPDLSRYDAVDDQPAAGDDETALGESEGSCRCMTASTT